MDLAKSRPDRFCWILRIRAAEGALRVRARSQIARARALFDRFSDISENLETEMWSGVDLNPRPSLRPFIAKLSANLAGNSEMIKAAKLQRALSPRIRPQMILSGP
jgi:hypothetical protein